MPVPPPVPRARGAFVFLCAGLLACALWLPLRGLDLYAQLDLHTFFVPELELHLHGEHGSGPALWNPHVQLGRPAVHFGGLSQAYWLNHVFTWMLDDVWRTHTALVLATLVLGGLFAWGFFRTLDLHPWAAAACALGFAYAPFHGHAGLYLCFVGGSAWTMGLAWALARNLRASTLGNGLLLAFVVHSAILGSYPQQLVWAGWLGLCLVLALLPPRGERGRALVSLGAWSALGVLSAAPFLLDMLAQTRGSSRAGFDAALFQVPGVTGARDLLVQLRELGDPLWNGRKAFTATAFHLWGGSFTPFFGATLLLALTSVRTRLVRWMSGFVLATLVLGLSSAAFLFGARYLGFRFSLFYPFAAATAPIFLLAAVGFDHALRVPGGPRRALHALALPVLLVAGALAAARPLDGWNVGVSLALAACAALALLAPAWPVLAVGALISAVHYGVLALPASPREGIAKRVEWLTPLADEVKQRAGGGRFGWVSEGPPLVLQCNTEQLYDLASIHSFDSLAPARYQAWTQRVSARGTEFLGRFFERIVGLEGLATEEFARSGVRVVLSPEELSTPRLRPSAVSRRVHVHEVVAPAPLEAWVPRSAYERTDGEVRIPGALASVGRPVERRAGDDGRIELVLAPRDEPGLLWLSQQFHPRWRAHAGDAPLETVAVDGFWQGVLVPAEVGEVVLEFRPWLRWWWVPQVAFALAGAGWAGRGGGGRRWAASRAGWTPGRG